MTTKIGQIIISPWITPVRVVSLSNIAGTYYNGIQNDGVGATLTISSTSLTIDNVVMVVSDRLLLGAQTDLKQNGIYIVKTISSSIVLQRASDQQSLEQYKPGQYVSIAAGDDNAGKIFTVTEPIPAVIGVNDLIWTPSATSGGGGSTIYSGITDLFFGGATSNTFSVPGLVSGWIITASNKINANQVSILQAYANTDQLFVQWSADPGFSNVQWIGGPALPIP